MPALNAADLAQAPRGESSGAVRERVTGARERQLRRQRVSNARLEGQEVEARARPLAAARKLLRDADASMMLSARAHHRVLKVARTIADLEGSERVSEDHIAEALRYRGAMSKKT